MARNNTLPPDKRFPKQSTHFIEARREVNPLYLSCSTPEVQGRLSLSIRAVETSRRAWTKMVGSSSAAIDARKALRATSIEKKQIMRQNRGEARDHCNAGIPISAADPNYSASKEFLP